MKQAICLGRDCRCWKTGHSCPRKDKPLAIFEQLADLAAITLDILSRSSGAVVSRIGTAMKSIPLAAKNFSALRQFHICCIDTLIFMANCQHYSRPLCNC